MKKFAFLLFIILISSSCNTKKYLPRPSDLSAYTKGFYFEVTLYDDSTFFGELISVNKYYLQFLPIKRRNNTLSYGALTAISKNKIKQIVIQVSQTTDNVEKLKAKAAFNYLASIGHGWFGIITLPINLGVFVSTINGAMTIEYPWSIQWNQLHKFARFPQGIPETINVSKIK